MADYDFSKLSVLVVDDSRAIRSMLVNFLRDFGVAQIFEAVDAEQAYLDIVELKPDLVITDWRMPPTDGIDLVRRIRKEPDSPNPYIPVIMLTGFAELQRVRQARDAGVTAFLAKPISGAALYKRLCAVVEDQRPFVRTQSFFGPDRRVKDRAEPYTGNDRRGK